MPVCERLIQFPIHLSQPREGLQCLHRILVLFFFFFWFRFTFGAPFARLLESFEVIVIKPRLATSNDEFEECRLLSYAAKHLFYSIFSTSLLQKMQVSQYEYSTDTLHAKKIDHKVLNRSIRDVENLCYFRGDDDFQGFINYNDIVINRGGWMTRLGKVFDDFMTCTKYFLPLKYCCL